MKTLKAMSLAIVLVLLSSVFVFSMEDTTITSAQGETTLTPEITPSTEDIDLLEEFEQSLTYETGPGFVEDQPCELPCWWGMTPGISSEEEVIEILQTTGFYRNWNLTEEGVPFDSTEQPIEGSITLQLSAKVFAPFHIAFGAEKGKLTRIAIEVNKPSKWFTSEQFDLATVLNQFEEEPVIYASVSRASFYVILEYPGMIYFYSYYLIDTPSRYTTNERGRVDGFIICSRDDIIQEIRVLLFNPEDKEVPDNYIYDPSTTPLLEERTLIGPETFITFFRENPKECLEVPLRSQEK
jgi:hypothetical protein